MARLKIFFHDNCFDGAASAAIFADFYTQRVAPGTDVALQGVQHRRGDPFEGLALDGDDNACVDFRYSPSPRMTWWFDHHVSAFQPPELRAQFEADRSGHKFYDPTAGSCSKFEADLLAEKFGWERSALFDELIHWADIIDSARFGSAEAAVELREPALRLMTWLEHNPEPRLTDAFIRLLGHRPLADIAGERWIAKALAPLLAEHQKNIALIRERAVSDRGVVSFDLSEDRVAAHNKFIAYYLFPDARYTVGITHSSKRTKISVGSNPWATAPRTHNIAAICERYGGGGHPVVGAVSLPPGEVARAREIAAEIRDELASG